MIASLSACGGGDGGISSTPTPLPLPLPSPSPTPTPSPGPTYNNFVSPTAAFSNAMTGAFSSYTTDFPTVPTTNGPYTVTQKTYGNSNLYFAYDPSSKKYQITDQNEVREFAQSDLSSSQFRGSAFDNYTAINKPGAVSGTTRDDYLTVYRTEGGNGANKVVLTYVTLVDWSTKVYSPTSTVITNRLAVSGFETLATDMPKSGTGTYLGVAIAYYSNKLPIAALDGTSLVIADFAKGSLTDQVILTGIVSGNQVSYTFTGTGSIQSASNRFSGSLGGSGFSGPVDGAFFGPQAKEVGFSYRLADANGAVIEGVAAGR